MSSHRKHSVIHAKYLKLQITVFLFSFHPEEGQMLIHKIDNKKIR